MQMNILAQGAFTLIELLVVELIIGVLTSIALPQYKVAVAKARLAGIRSAIASVKQAEELYYLANGEYTNSVAVLDIDLPQCPKDAQWNDVAICGKWMIDPFNGSATTVWDKSSIRAAFCPDVVAGTKKWADCEAQADYTFIHWLNHSNHPNEIGCEPKQGSDLGQKICKSVSK